jgi:FMN-dependent NADH-azoreductase
MKIQENFMANLLHIDASARRERSITRALGRAFISHWLQAKPADQIIYRDIGTTPPDFISEAWISAAFTDEENRTVEQHSLLELSDSLIRELSDSSAIIISTPMYNYGMPAALKAWIDQVIRANKTFTFDLSRGDYPLEPVLAGKSLVILTSCGEFGFGAGEARESMNHLTPHLRTLSKYLGIESIHEVSIEYQEFNDARHQASIENAYKALPNLVQQVIATLESNT